MSEKNTLSNSARHMREHVVLGRLRRRFRCVDADSVSDDEDEDVDFDGRFTWEKGDEIAFPTEYERENVVLDAEFEDTKTWLDGLALEEQTKVSLLEAD